MAGGLMPENKKTCRYCHKTVLKKGSDMCHYHYNNSLDEAFDEKTGKRVCKRKRTNGEACGKPVVRGATVCTHHGAAKGSVIRKQADEKVQKQEAEKSIRKFLRQAEGISSIEALTVSLQRAEAASQALVEIIANEEEMSKSSLNTLIKAASEQSRIAKVGIDTNTAEKQIAIQRAEAAASAELLTHALLEAGVEKEKVRAALKIIQKHLGE